MGNRPNKLRGSTTKVKTPYGSIYITINLDENNNPCEIFIVIGKAGSEIMSYAESVARLISMLLNKTKSEDRISVCKDIIESLSGIGGARQNGSKNKSLPDTVANTIRKVIEND